MPTVALPRPPSPSVSTRRIDDVVYRSLEAAVRRQCAWCYGEYVILRRLDRAAASKLMRLQIECRDLVELSVDITATNVGGNVFDIGCRIEDGPSRQVAYALPEGMDTALSQAPGLGQRLARFLLSELDRELGRRSPEKGDE